MKLKSVLLSIACLFGIASSADRYEAENAMIDLNSVQRLIDAHTDIITNPEKFQDSGHCCSNIPTVLNRVCDRGHKKLFWEHGYGKDCGIWGRIKTKIERR